MLYLCIMMPANSEVLNKIFRGNKLNQEPHLPPLPPRLSDVNRDSPRDPPPPPSAGGGGGFYRNMKERAGEIGLHNLIPHSYHTISTTTKHTW
jgi:hypothetical protein